MKYDMVRDPFDEGVRDALSVESRPGLTGPQRSKRENQRHDRHRDEGAGSEEATDEDRPEPKEEQKDPTATTTRHGEILSIDTSPIE